MKTLLRTCSSAILAMLVSGLIFCSPTHADDSVVNKGIIVDIANVAVKKTVSPYLLNFLISQSPNDSSIGYGLCRAAGNSGQNCGS